MKGPRLTSKRAACHPDRAHYARGLCLSCYQTRWKRGALPKRATEEEEKAMRIDEWEKKKEATKRRLEEIDRKAAAVAAELDRIEKELEQLKDSA